MSIMLILPGVRDSGYAEQRSFGAWDCASSGEAIRLINEDDRSAIGAVYGIGADVGRVIDSLDNITKVGIRLVVVRGNHDSDPPWKFNGPWELVYRE